MGGEAHLLSPAALFAYGGRLADTVGHRRVVVTGVLGCALGAVGLRAAGHVRASLLAGGVPVGQAGPQAHRIGQSHEAPRTGDAIPLFIRTDFAEATRTVFYVMSGIMAAASLVAWFGLRAGLQPEEGAAAGTARWNGIPGTGIGRPDDGAGRVRISQRGG